MERIVLSSVLLFLFLTAQAETSGKSEWVGKSMVIAFTIGTLSAALAVWLKIRQGKTRE